MTRQCQCEICHAFGHCNSPATHVILFSYYQKVLCATCLDELIRHPDEHEGIQLIEKIERYTSAA